MDVVTHVLAGYVMAFGVAVAVHRGAHRLLAWRATRRAGSHAQAATPSAGPGSATSWAAIAGLAALAPDLDLVFTPLLWIDAMYPLQHRGATHSILGAPIMAGLVAAAMAGAHRLWGRRWPRLEVFRWRWPLVGPLLIGAWSHLVLDVVTHQGAPLAWPLAQGRTSLEIYFWIIWWLAPLSAVPLVMRYRGRWDDRRMAQAAVVVLVIIVAVGAVRVAEKPAGDEVFATRDPAEWIVAKQHGNGTWRLDLLERDEVRHTRWYGPVMAGAGGQEAAASVLATDAYRGFRFASSAPQVVQVDERPGGWNVTVIDTVQRFGFETGPAWQRDWREDTGLLRASVVEGRVRVDAPGPWR